MQKVAVVVPIHNAEENLVECLESIQNQSLQDIKIICVNDASEDNSVKIVNDFVNDDSRFVLLENETCLGAGNARNKGLEYADASYIVFWDSDEVYCKTLLEDMYTTALRFDADVILAERGILDPETGVVTPEGSRKYQEDGYSERGYNIFDMPEYALSMWPSSPINRMVRKSLIDEYQIRFQDLRSSNDVFYADMTMLLADRIAHIDSWEPMIYVRRNLPGSISANRDPYCSYKAFAGIKERLVQLDKWTEYQRYVCLHYASAIFAEMKKCKSESLQREYFEFTRTEGVHNIWGRENFKYMISESRYANQLFLLCTADFEVRCWDSNYKIRKSLYENKGRLRSFFECLRIYHKRAIVYPSGAWSDEIVDFVKKNFMLEIEYSDNIGCEDIDIVIVVNRMDYELVRKRITSGNRDMEVFALFEYFACPSAEQCTRLVVVPRKEEREVSVKSDILIERDGKSIVVELQEESVVLSDEKDEKLSEHHVRLGEIVQVINRLGVKVAIWDANDGWTVKLIKYLREHFQYELECVVVPNMNHVGTMLEGVPVVVASSIPDNIDLLIVTDTFIVDDVTKRMQEENYKIQLFLFYLFLEKSKLSNCVQTVMLTQEQIRSNKAHASVAERLENNSTRICQLFETMKDKKVALWGAGIWGHELTDYMNRHMSQKLHCLIDNNMFLVGSTVNDVKVYDFESICEEVDIILVATSKVYEEIVVQVRKHNNNILIFTLYQYMLGDEFDMCIS